MNIKNIFESERWTKNIWNNFAQTAHNEMLDRIEKAVMEHITDLEDEAKLSHRLWCEQIILNEKQKECIAELEQEIYTIEDEAYSKGFAEGYSEKEQEDK